MIHKMTCMLLNPVLCYDKEHCYSLSSMIDCSMIDCSMTLSVRFFSK